MEHVKAEAWRRGRLRYQTRKGAQRWLYDRAHKQRELFPGVAEPLVLLCHRQLGKSHLSILLCVEECISNPGCVVNFCCDTLENARKMWEDHYGPIILDMPKCFKMWTRKDTIYFRHKDWPKHTVSKLRLRGIDYRRGDGLRGGNTSMVVIDETRNVSHLEAVIRKVITPMWRGQKRPLFIQMTTPPDNEHHDSWSYCKRAEKNNSLVRIPASQNPDWDEDDERIMLTEYVSKDDPDWLRELEVEMISDRSRLVIPEWSDMRDQCFVPEIVRPSHYRAFVSLDMGWKDHSGATFALYDFANRRIGVLNELFVHYTPTEEFAELLVQKIEETFPRGQGIKLRIIADATSALGLADLNYALRKHRLRVQAAQKWDREAAINNLRSGIAMGRIQVQHNCVETDEQLKNVVWNKTRKDFERDKAHGHYDLVDSLIYLNRAINWDSNPYPVQPGRSNSTTIVDPLNDQNWLGTGRDRKSAETLATIFGKELKPRR